MRATFRDPRTQHRLDRDGFAVVDLLTGTQVEQLRSSYRALGPVPGDPSLACHSSFHSYDREYKLAVDRAIRDVLGPEVDRRLDRQRSLPCNFIVKWPAATSGFGLHQDLTLVDERHHRSVELWVALDDTNERNGQLWMCPGSHTWIPGHIRGINGFPFPFAGVAKRIIARHARPIALRAGQAIVFDHATLHFSFPNRTDEPRMVAITDLIPEEAQHLHYFGSEDGGIDVYEVGDEFWTDNTPFTLWKPPARTALVDHLERPEVSFTDDDLDRLVSTGRAIDLETGARGAINAAGGWCHRCGSRDLVDTPDRWIGNVTLLCGNCRGEEAQRAPSPAHVAPAPS